jgi:hypothetical protein
MCQRLMLFGLVVLALAGLLVLAFLGGTSPPSSSASTPSQPIPAPADIEAGFHSPLPHPIKDPRIVVAKSAHRMELFSGGTLLRTYPEGDYAVCFKNPNSKYYLALGLNYPNAEDARRAFSAGLITKSQRDAILEAVERGSCTPRNTPLGGDIVIHGRGSGADWTAGCVALDDDNMRELYDAVSVGTPVIIKP